MFAYILFVLKEISCNKFLLSFLKLKYLSSNSLYCVAFFYQSFVIRLTRMETSLRLINFANYRKTNKSGLKTKMHIKMSMGLFKACVIASTMGLKKTASKLYHIF